MTREELCLNFVNKIGENDYSEIYKFFTKETTYFIINEKKELTYEEMLNFLKENINSLLEIKRVLESKVCIKYETAKLNFFFEVKQRRIKRLEIEVL
ncbi:MAG: hypothetical protein E7180_02500 [Erysipelotrichaceae bacterium]|nr:hypothetical protein [Erysipelotrichaceae bacterium]